jgi:hypothetical protein
VGFWKDIGNEIVRQLKVPPQPSSHRKRSNELKKRLAESRKEFEKIRKQNEKANREAQR